MLKRPFNFWHISWSKIIFLKSKLFHFKKLDTILEMWHPVESETLNLEQRLFLFDVLFHNSYWVIISGKLILLNIACRWTASLCCDACILCWKKTISLVREFPLLTSLSLSVIFLKISAIVSMIHGITLNLCIGQNSGQNIEFREVFDVAVARAVAEMRILGIYRYFFSSPS